MARRKAKINMRGLRREVDRKTKGVLTKAVRSKAEKAIERARRELVEDFLTHPITREIEEGPEAHNISDTLGGIGNLFSYIGFEEGSDPIAPVRAYLQRAIKIESIQGKNLVFKLTLALPSKDDIAALSPVPWAPGRSWVSAMEFGLSGLGKYLVKESPVSRSGSAIEVKAKLRSGAFKNKKYMSAILLQLQNNILNALK